MSTARNRSRRKGSGEFLTVMEVARGANVEAHVVRFYARTGLIRAARYAANGYRQFVPFDIKRVRFVRAAQSLGFTLAEIREILRRSRLRQTPCPLVRDIMARRLADAAGRLKELQAMHERMQRASEQWRHMPDSVPTESDICVLIESAVEDSPAAPPGTARGSSFVSI
jgi:MerR family transcriptional regulator, Zn(II)-responsive regulator of zntA